MSTHKSPHTNKGPGRKAQVPPLLGSLCSGIGGIDLGAVSAGFRIVWQCEKDVFCQKILKKNFPGTRLYNDIEEMINEKKIERPDVFAAGLPCQPYSTAGQRRGAEDNRHVWPAAFRLIERLRPRWLIIENVIGFVNLALGSVLSDLESIGYNFPTDRAGEYIVPVIPIAAVGAPQIRRRVFVIAFLGDDAEEQKSIPDPNGARFAGGIFGNWVETADREMARKKLGELDRVRPIELWREEIESCIRGSSNGIPARMDRIKALGNSCSPMISYLLFKYILKVEQSIFN